MGSALRVKKPPIKKEAPLTSLPNIGQVTAAQLNEIGITTREEFLRRDLYEVFDELLKKVDPTLCRSALAGIIGASKGVRWHAVSKESAREFAQRYPHHVWGKC